jgi:hypothetical protein
MTNLPAQKIAPHHMTTVLAPRGLAPTDVERFGVYSVDEAPFESKFAAGSGLVFPWRSPSGEVVLQYRPDEPKLNDKGDPVKYVFPGGSRMVLNALRVEPTGAVILAEGTMQSIAAAIYAPTGMSVFGLSGCWSWRNGDTSCSIADLEVVEDRDVFVILDADAATNLNVYNAGMSLREALLGEGATGVNFVRLPGAGQKAGLDDVLASKDPDKRAQWLMRQITSAATKPADTKPKPTSKKQSAPQLAKATPDGRPIIVVNEDRRAVIGQIVETMKDKFSGDTVFSYGGILARRKGVTMEPISKDVLYLLLSEATRCVALSTNGTASDAWPDVPTVGAVLASNDDFAELRRIVTVPFVRPDGSIVTTSGYDEPTKTFTVLDSALEGIQTGDDVPDAVKFLCDEWLGDFMPALPTPADRANLLGLMLTPLVRGLVSLAPLAILDGLQMGVGKNLLADLLAIITTGVPAMPLPYTKDDDETRKVITSAFRQGSPLFIFDEAHTIEGGSFSRALTSVTYTDRLLGGSRMGEYPNTVTWLALGNQVQVNADMNRRVYYIGLTATVPNPQDRDPRSFRHPDIREWTRAHRAEILSALLTLVRSWIDDGRPTFEHPTIGSFEQWSTMVGGILTHAGIEGFLTNLVEKRSETDYHRAYWIEHLQWLDRTFSAPFTTQEVTSKLKLAGAAPPPDLDDVSSPSYARQLGQAYGRMKGRVMDGLSLRKSAVVGHGKAGRWVIDTIDDGGNGGSPSSPNVTETSYIYEVPDNAVKKEQTGGSGPSSFLSLHAATPERPTCPDCDAPLDHVEARSGFWLACRACHPETFDWSA